MIEAVPEERIAHAGNDSYCVGCYIYLFTHIYLIHIYKETLTTAIIFCVISCLVYQLVTAVF